MRIAIVTAWYPSDDNPLYGIFIQNQAKALAKHCDVYVLLLKWSLVPYTRERKEEGLTIIERGSFYFPNASEMLLNFWARQYLRFFKSLHKKYSFDLVHCHDHYGAFVGAKMKESIGLPLVCTIHNSNIMNDKLVDWKKAYLSRILQQADRVFSVGKKLAGVLEQKYKVKNIKVVPNFIDTDLFNHHPKEKNDTFSFLFVGGLETHKGVWELVKAFHLADLEDSSLHIVGSGYLLQRIESYVDENDLKHSVVLHGELENEILPDIYNSCHVYVSASEYETFGVTILEAMSCGLPVLYTPSGGANQLVNEAAGILITDTTEEGIAAGLKTIKQNYNRFKRHEIRQHVLDNFGREKSIGALLNEYKLLIDGSA